jgi:HEAT repeat protein
VDEIQERDPAEVGPEPIGPEEDERPTFLVVAQFFLIPLVVIAVCVGIFYLFGALTQESRSALDYLAEVRTGSKARRFQAAYELSKLLVYEKEAAREPGLATELARVFVDLEGGDEPEARRYLALALGHVADPRTVDALLSGLGDPDAETRIYTVWALGAVGDPRAVPPLVGRAADSDPAVRKMALYTLGSLGDERALPALRTALEDSVVDVRWNAALGLAQMGDPSGRVVLHRMLDHTSLDAIEKLQPQQKQEAMLNAIRALGLLGDVTSTDLLETLSRDDPDLEIRSEARKVLNILQTPDS